jgi:ribosomal protein S18 acetylase RimI-like enzyme
VTDLDRTVALMCKLRRTWARREVPILHGTAYLDSRLPKLWDSNFLAVEDEAAEAESVNAEAERIRAQEGTLHHKLWIDDEALGARLEPGLRARGWEPNPLLVLILRRDPERPPLPHRVEELGLSQAEEVRRGTAADNDWVTKEDDIRQVLQAKRIKAAAGARFFAAFADDVPASVCDLYSGDGVGQIEDVVTLPSFRGRGLAGALVLRTAAAAREAGAELVFLLAAEDDEVPVRLYRRLGFDKIGRVWEFNRPV